MIKYILADVTLFRPLELGNTTPIFLKDDFKFVSELPCLLGHPVVNKGKGGLIFYKFRGIGGGGVKGWREIKTALFSKIA